MGGSRSPSPERAYGDRRAIRGAPRAPVPPPGVTGFNESRQKIATGCAGAPVAPLSRIGVAENMNS